MSRMRNQKGFTLVELMIVVAIIGILAAISIPAYRDYSIRAKVTELATAASACKTSFAEYYQVQGLVPGTPLQAGCSSMGTANSKAPDIVGGEIIVAAAGTLLSQLGAASSTFALKPNCGAAGCVGGAAIQGWNCSSSLGTSTNILPKYLPAACR
jgi:type IV pilus assembly protein PilA